MLSIPNTYINLHLYLKSGVFLFILFLFSGYSYSQNSIIKQISEEVKLSEKALVENNKADEAIIHATKAQLLYDQNKVDDDTLQRDILLKFIGVFDLLNQNERSIQYLKQLIQLQLKTDSIGTLNFCINAGRLAGVYMGVNELDSAEHYFKFAKQGAEAWGNKLFLSSAYNNLGIYYANTGAWDKAKEYYDKALNTLEYKSLEDSLFQSSVLDNISDYYLFKRDTLKAIDLIHDNAVFVSAHSKKGQRIVRYLIKLCKLQLTQGNYQETDSLIHEISRYINKSANDRWRLKTRIDRLKLERQLAYQTKNQSREFNALNQLDSLQSIYLAIANRENNQVNESINTFLAKSASQEIDLLKERQSIIERDNQLKSFAIAFTVIIAIIISLLILSTYRRRLQIRETEKRLQAKELKLKEIENQELNRNLTLKDKDFSDLLMQTALKEDWNQSLVKDLQTLIAGQTKVDVSMIKSLILKLKQRSGINEKLAIKEKGLAQVNAAFFERLNQRFPKLTKSEKELCGLLKMKLENKEIALIRNIDPSSVRKLKYRLKKKMALSAEEDLQKVLDEIKA